MNDRVDSQSEEIEDDPRRKIIFTAERLYALQGLDFVSFEQINKEAGLSEGVWVEDYFGSTEELLIAISELRIGPVDEQRALLLAALKQKSEGGIPPLRELAEIMVRPAFDDLSANQVTYSRRFICQFRLRLDLMDKIMARRLDFGFRECFRLIRWQSPHIPNAVLIRRYAQSMAFIVDASANVERLFDQHGDNMSEEHIELRIECAIDTIQALMEAKPSPRALYLGEREDENRRLRQASKTWQTYRTK